MRLSSGGGEEIANRVAAVKISAPPAPAAAKSSPKVVVDRSRTSIKSPGGSKRGGAGELICTLFMKGSPRVPLGLILTDDIYTPGAVT